MKGFYTQALFSILVLTGLSVSIYIYEATDERIQVAFYGEDSIALEESIERKEQESFNQIDEEMRMLLEKQSDLVIQAKVYAQVYGNDGFFENTTQVLKNHLGFVQVLYGLSNDQFPVLTQSPLQVPLEATISDGVRIDNQEAEDLLKLDIQTLGEDYQKLSRQVDSKEEKVILSFQNLVIDRIE